VGAAELAEDDGSWFADVSDIEESEIDRELVAKGGLREFINVAWPRLEPREFLGNWHIDLICEHLEAIHKGTLRRLIINIPPGCMKSLLISVMWPAWVWTHHPQKKWIFASYEAGLALRDARKMRNLVDSQWWHMRWPDCSIPFEHSRSVREFDNSQGGFRFSTSIAGGVTGRHADIQVVDDPIKPLDVEGGRAVTKTKLQQALGWWTGTMPTRMSDPKTGARVIVMQRLHQADLAGEMLRIGDEDGEAYEHLCLPMRFEEKRKSSTSVGADLRATDGELLWPERFSEAEVVGLEKAMGARVSAAQLQQRPSPAGGAIFRTEWFQHYGTPGTKFEKLPPISRMRLVQSWDCTFKALDTSDYVVGQVWGFWQAHAFLLDQVRGQWSFAQTCKELIKLSEKWPRAWKKMIEDKANGPAVANVLEDKIPGIVLVNPQGGKEARANAVEPVWETGNVWLPPPSEAPWVNDFKDRLEGFPSAKYDDEVDAMSQALLPFAKGSRVERLRKAMENLI
jgi:predicted phage terminase large subunit-like protein